MQIVKNNDNLSNTQSFINQNCSIYEAVEKFKTENQDILVVLDEHFSIKGTVLKEDVLAYYEENKHLEYFAKEKISKLIHVKKTTVIIYPQNNNFNEIIGLMKRLKLKAVAIANNPWEKKYLGMIVPKDINNMDLPANLTL